MHRKMYLAAVMGAVRDLDRSFVSCLKGYEIYLKDAMLMEGAEALTEGRALFPFEGIFPYEHEAVFLSELWNEYGNIIKGGAGKAISQPGKARRQPSQIKDMEDAAAFSREEEEAVLRLLSEKEDKRSCLAPFQKEFHDLEGTLDSEKDPERLLEKGQRLNELHGEILSLRQQIYDIDMSLMDHLRENASRIRTAKDILRGERETWRLREHAAFFLEGGREKRFIICFMAEKKDIKAMQKERAQPGRPPLLVNTKDGWIEPGVSKKHNHWLYFVKARLLPLRYS